MVDRQCFGIAVAFNVIFLFRITVRYDDGLTAKLKENEIHFKTDFEKNQKAHVLDEQAQGYTNGYILHSERFAFKRNKSQTVRCRCFHLSKYDHHQQPQLRGLF